MADDQKKETPKADEDSPKLHLMRWLRDCGLSEHYQVEYFKKFVDQEFDKHIHTIATLNDQDLEKMGVSKLAHRKAMLNQKFILRPQKKYSLSVCVIKDKLELHLHDSETKYVYHDSFGSEDLQKCGYPANYACKLDAVAKLLESARRGNKNWTLSIGVESKFGIIKLVKKDEFFPLEMVMKLKMTPRNEIDILKEHIQDLKKENRRGTKHCVPKGSILIWSGNETDIPKGWTLCDGSDDAPDLRDRFVVGSSTNKKAHSESSKGFGLMNGGYHLPQYYAMCYIMKVV